MKYQYKKFGIMLDCSRNGVMRVEEVKKIISILAKMGYNTFMLYTEDTYEIEGEPYFGHFRARYTQDELKAIDSYCAKLGVELIPCIQTLAHLQNIFKWQAYSEIHDRETVLLCDDEKTYALIEKMFQTLATCFTSRTVHIGMDEARELGLGSYLKRNGYKSQKEIFFKHLKRVCAIAKKYGFSPLIWSDMMFESPEEYHGCYGEVEVSETVKKICPEGTGLVYWYYYLGNPYDAMFATHKKICQKINSEFWFAGGAWSWTGYLPKNGYTLKTMCKAMDACAKHGVENVLITLWGDNGKECSYFSMLPSLLVLIERAKGNYDENSIKVKFKEITGEDYDAFMSLDLIEKDDYCGQENPCHYMLFDDPFASVLQHTAPIKTDFSKYVEKLGSYAEKSEYPELFRCISALASALEIKYMLGRRTRDAYSTGDKMVLAKLVKEYEELHKRLQLFYEALRVLWVKENKPTGFEVQQLRLGGLMLRVLECRDILQNHLSSGEPIPALEEGELDYYGGVEKKEEKACLVPWHTGFTVNTL